MADFVLGRLKFKWRGDWAVSTAYLIDDIVKYGGNTYVVTANHTSQSSIANFIQIYQQANTHYTQRDFSLKVIGQLLLFIN